MALLNADKKLFVYVDEKREPGLYNIRRKSEKIRATFYPKFENEKTDQESSLMLSVDSSQECEPTDLTPAKRRGTVIDNLDKTFDQNFVSRTPCSTRIKKEKTDKSG
ncbi:unnamed protein product [Brassica oleracea]|uniref:(rape) hypothetical protein n=1 Tax=Brassica napus TaxID=3708 RepID=A0A816LSH3_BRANA|nr:unnamed protein product [Brassica napus]